MKSLLTKNNSLCLLIDVQEKLLPTISENSNLVKELQFFLHGLKLLEIPLLISEQYPVGLGRTIPSLLPISPNAKILAKTEFSCFLNTEIKKEINATDKKQVILIGIESHVCVLQTALQMLQHGFEIFIPQECTGSRSPANKTNALQRIQNAGGIITNTESCLFEILESSHHPSFKSLSHLLKSH